MANGNVYALLIAVGRYEDHEVKDLPTFRMDLSLIQAALSGGLKIPDENIRLLGGDRENGFVKAESLARVIAEYRSMMQAEDSFVFYFSGHGCDKSLSFSDKLLDIQSVVDYISSLPVKNKLVILDCCYAGNFSLSSVRKFDLKEALADFVGQGIAVLASSSKDEDSNIFKEGLYSVFTGALSSAIVICSKSCLKNGKVFLSDIFHETRIIMEGWNVRNPGKSQTPVFRSCMVGMTSFPIKKEYCGQDHTAKQWETCNYKVIKTKRIDSQLHNRNSIFAVLNHKSTAKELSVYTREIENHLSEERNDAIWCYFGIDESDIIHHLHWAYTIFAKDENVRDRFYKSVKNSVIIEGVYVWTNQSYDLLKQIQKPSQTREQYVWEINSFLAIIVTLAEQFINDMQEVVNHTLSANEMKDKYDGWIRQVKRTYLRLSDGDSAPDDLQEWTEEVMSLAGWILDLSIYLEREEFNRPDSLPEGDMWLARNAINHYYECLERLIEIEQETHQREKDIERRR